jgi:hypothetical protein
MENKMNILDKFNNKFDARNIILESSRQKLREAYQKIDDTFFYSQERKDLKLKVHRIAIKRPFMKDIGLFEYKQRVYCNQYTDMNGKRKREGFRYMLDEILMRIKRNRIHFEIRDLIKQ